MIMHYVVLGNTLLSSMSKVEYDQFLYPIYPFHMLYYVKTLAEICYTKLNWIFLMLCQNKKERKKVREVGILKKDPESIREQIEKLEVMSKHLFIFMKHKF